MSFRVAAYKTKTGRRLVSIGLHSMTYEVIGEHAPDGCTRPGHVWCESLRLNSNGSGPMSLGWASVVDLVDQEEP